MRVAQFGQLPPERPPLHSPPRLGQLLHGRVLVHVPERFALLRVRDLVRMAPLVASFSLHIARRRVACHPPVMVSRCTPNVGLASLTAIPFSTAAMTRIRKS
jgi:hypothetical protein